MIWEKLRKGKRKTENKKKRMLYVERLFNSAC